MKRALKYLLYLFSFLLLLMAGLMAMHWHSDIPLETLEAKYHYPDSKSIRIQDMKVHYRDVGEGMPLVLIHGTAASLHTWEGWIDRLSPHFRVIAMDLPAFGLTGPHPNRDYSMGAYTSFVDAFLQALNIDSCHIAGNSLGGQICWNYAIRYPDRLRKMVLLDASGFEMDKPMPLGFRLAQNPVTRPLLTRVTPKSLHRSSLLEVYGDDRKVTEALVDRYFELMLRPGNRTAFVDRANQLYTGELDKLSTITLPTLILWGEEDRWIDLWAGQRFDEELSNANLIVYPGVGHVPMEEIPEQSAADVLAFLRPAASEKPPASLTVSTDE
ncbi:MAG: alpha/beta hydrolase [Bacteroidota bacterium]